MILRLSSSAARLTLVLISFLFALALSFLSIRNALAAHAAGLTTLAGYEKSTRLEPLNAQNWYLLGRYWQYNLDESDPQRAIAAYRQSLAVDSHSAATWLDLGTVYELQDDVPNARGAYLQAKRVYPASAEVSWRYGNFLLRQGELPDAFAEIRSAVYADPDLGGQAFSRCWRVDPDVHAILDKVLPPNPAVYIQSIRELEQDLQLSPAIVVWDRLVSIHPHLKLSDIFFFVDSLKQNGRVAESHRVWTEAVALSALPDFGDPPGSVLWDGGFESGIRGGGFAWIFSRPEGGGVQTSLDSNQKHSGRQSLRLVFDGERNVNFHDVCEVASVQPSVMYRLSGWIRTQALVTDEGPLLRLIWRNPAQIPESIDTPEVHGTQPWTEVAESWTAGKDTQLVQVCISRRPSAKMDNRIHGSAWIDDVALIPELAKP